MDQGVGQDYLEDSNHWRFTYLIFSLTLVQL